MGLFRLPGMATLATVAAMTTCVAVIAVAALSDTADASTIQYSMGMELLDRTNANTSVNGSQVNFNLTVSNTCEWLYQVVINLTDVPQGWQYNLKLVTKVGTFRSNGTLTADLASMEKALLQVTIDPTANNTNGTYWMTLLAKLKGLTVNQSMRLGVMIGRFLGFELSIWNEPPEGYFAAIPPSQIYIRFAIVNNGSVTDRFLVRYTCNMADAGWTLKPIWGIDDFGWTKDVPPDPGGVNPYFVDFQLPIPAEEKGGVRAWIVVNATSSLDQPEREKSADTIVKALAYYDFQVYINGADKKGGTPGERVEFYLRIWNRGNAQDVFTITPVWDEQLNPGFIATTNPQVITIPSNETDQVTYLVSIPGNAPKRLYYFSAKISSSSKELAIVTKSFEVDVGQFYKIGLSSPEPRMTTIPGGYLDFEVDVRNAGNGLDFITIQLLGVPSGWLTYIQPPEVSLLQNEQSKVSIRVIVPSRFEEAPMGSYNLTVKADSSRSDAEAVYDLQLDITPFFRIEWMYQDQPITDPTAPIAQLGIIKPRRSFNPYERDYIDITLELKNLGNANDNIQVWGVGADPRVDVTVTPEWALLLSDETKLVKVHIKVPRELPPDKYTVFVNATSQDAMTPTRVVPLDFEVYNLDASIPVVPTCHDMDKEGAIANATYLHDEYTLWLNVANTGTRPLSSVQVRVYDSYVQNGRTVRWNFFSHNISGVEVSATYFFSHFEGSTNDPAIHWWANVAGRHTLEFRVFYDHQSNATNDVAYLELIVVKATPPASPSLMPLFFVFSLVLFFVAIVFAAVLFIKRRARREPTPLPEIWVDPASFARALPPFEPVPDRVALMPPATREQVALYGQDLDGEEVDQVVEKPVNLEDDDLGP